MRCSLSIHCADKMRSFSRLLANPTTVGSSNALKPAPLALLPPIPLYRRLLRAHRKHLPRQMRLLGDEYIKSEYRAHRNVENPMHIASVTERPFRRGTRLTTSLQIGFLTEWQMYAQKIEGDSWYGEKIDKSKIDKMSGTKFLGLGNHTTADHVVACQINSWDSSMN